MDRRDFINKSVKAAIGLAIYHLPNFSYGNEKENIESIIETEPYKWTDIKIYDYWGELTSREMFLKKIKEGLTSPEFQKFAEKFQDTQKLRYFVSEEGRSSGIGDNSFIEPTSFELKDYQRFLSKFSNYEGLDLIKKVYDDFQNKIGGKRSYNFNKTGFGFTGDPMLHPAVLLSKREKGVCSDKAFALYDIYKKQGLKSRIPEGREIKNDVSESHIWTRLYLDGTYIDLDPTFYNQFKAVRRENYKGSDKPNIIAKFLKKF